MKQSRFGALVLMMCLIAPARVLGAFGVTSGGGTFTVDTGAGLVFRVSTNSGDINSILYNSVQYQSTGDNSHLGSGLGTATVTATNLNNSYIKITCVTVGTGYVPTPLTHYYIVTNGLNTIFMATYVTGEPNVGELRWITRLQTSKLPGGPVPSDNRGNTGAIESADIFGMADGTTRSKYYGDTTTHGKDRAMDLTYCGATGTSVGVWMVFDNPRESASGGPFFRDIQNQCGSSDQEIYNYMNSGHNQTEANRTNVLHGPYALVFNNGSPPTAPFDYSWIETANLNLTGFVPKSGRGVVTGAVTGVPPQFQAVVGFSRSNAQYWAVASNGTYATPLMKPGAYAATLYKGELAVTNSSVTVSAGATNTLNLTSGEPNPSYIFRIGEWDGTPNGFLNATNIVGMIQPNFITMHPSDVRMTPWVGPPTYIVESNSPSSFPSIQMRLTNSPITIKFNLAPNQITNLTLRIGITCAYHNGRPSNMVNNVGLPGPAASSQPNSRSFTLGTYRGNNALFTYNISSNILLVGQNTLKITPISGTADLGPWLSAGYVFDCIELDGPAASSPPAAPTGLMAIASNAQVALSWNSSAGATGYNAKRSNASGGPYSIIASNVPTTNCTDTNVVAGSVYYYVVSAINAAGESADSSAASTYVPSIFQQWQLDYFGCTNCPEAMGNFDADADGMSNTNEFLAGMNPTNNASAFRILTVTPQANDMVITWRTAGGRTNAAQTTSGNYSTNFADIGSPIIVVGNGDTITNYVDAGGATNNSSRYYRIRLVP